MTDLYRLVYVSKNLLQGSDAENSAAVEQILATSQRNNGAAGVTGALMFNGGAFAQVLEGPRAAVEDTFERIQRDLRHGEVTVLQCDPAESRSFANWSMAFVGQSAQGRALWNGLAAMSGFDLSRLDGDAVFSTLHGLVLDEESVLTAAVPSAEITSSADRTVAAFDAPRAKAEIKTLIADLGPARTGVSHLDGEVATAQAAQGQEQKPSGRQARAAEAALAILKAALASERERTTELRNEVDDLQVALAFAQDGLVGLRTERDLWAKRARLLAAALCQEATSVSALHGEGSAPTRVAA